MRPFTVRIIANNAAGSWQSWPEKIAAIKAFYAPSCDLNIELSTSQLTPQFVPYETNAPGVYRVNEAWYEANVLPLAPGADMVIFVVPPADHPSVVTLLGLDYYQQGKTGELTVFADETSHIYQNEVDQGEAAVVMSEHEISHYFYDLLGKTDNTHLYFFAGTPAKVLADFDFNETLLGDYQQLVQTLEQYLGLLKSRQVAPNADLATAINVQNALQTPPGATKTQDTASTQIPLVDALIMVESGGDDSATGDNGLAFGCLQVHAGVVANVNGALGTSYKPSDTLGNRALSLLIFNTYFDKCFPQFTTNEDRAKCWNGGPGFKEIEAEPNLTPAQQKYIKNIAAYWTRVQAALNGPMPKGA